MKLLLPKEDAQRIADYLASRPWGEVNNLLVMLARAEEVKEADEKAVVEPKENN